MSSDATTALRACFEGAIPAIMATCAADGTPNVAYISQVFHVDGGHVALSFQFFNKTRQNILANPFATLLLMDPRTAAFHRLHVRYLRTETGGPLFEGMKAQLAGIASHSGMAAVFRLRGADVYRVESVEAVEGEQLPAPPPRSGLLAAVRRAADGFTRCTATDELLQGALAVLTDALGIGHAMVLMHDPATDRLYTLASTGYASSGVGSEIPVGHGVIGVAARERTAVRIGHMTNAASYSHAFRKSVQADAPELLEVEIPFPGLAQPRSQVALPIVSAGRLLGVLFAESECDMAFGFEDEDALAAIAGHLGTALDLLQAAAEPAAEATAQPPARAPVDGTPLQVRRYPVNDSVFIDGQYLIKGVAGAILCKLLREYAGQGRTEFSNRELRLDGSLGLPDVADNLEARLLLLQRRLAEQCPALRIEKTGRGRFALRVGRPVRLDEAG